MDVDTSLYSENGEKWLAFQRAMLGDNQFASEFAKSLGLEHVLAAT
jgi:hypothetical protein